MTSKPMSPTMQAALEKLMDGQEHCLNQQAGDALVSRKLATRRTAPSANEKGYVCWYRRNA